MAEAVIEPQTEYIWPSSLLLNQSDVMHFSCTRCRGIPKSCYSIDDNIYCEGCSQSLNHPSNPTKCIPVQTMINNLQTKCLSIVQNAPLNEDTENEANIDEKHCEWTGRLVQFNDHQNECPCILIECESCEQYQCQRRLIQQHQAECPEVYVECELSCGLQICRRETDSHIANVCVKKLLFCSNDDCKMQIERQHFDTHIQQQCNQRIINCSFANFGCSERIKAIELEQHLNQNKFEHLSQKFEFITDKQNEKIAELQQTNLQQHQIITDLRNELNILKLGQENLNVHVDSILDEQKERNIRSAVILEWSEQFCSEDGFTFNDNRTKATRTSNGHRYLIPYCLPVRRGKYCWRIKIYNNQSWMMMGVSQHKVHQNNSFEEDDVIGNCGTTGEFYGSAQHNNINLEHFNYCGQVDILLDLSREDYKMNICQVGQCNDEKEVKYWNMPGVQRGLVPHLNVYSRGISVTIAKIPPSWYGSYQNISFPL